MTSYRIAKIEQNKQERSHINEATINLNNNTIINNKMENKMLYFLNPANKYHRILRRGIVIGALTFLSTIGLGVIETNPEMIPIMTAIFAILDKFISEARAEK